MRNSKTISAVLLVAATLVILNQVGRVQPSTIVKRSFVRLGCMGQYDKSDFATLDHICEECYNIYRVSGLHAQCRSSCFKNEYFSGCLKALLLQEKKGEIDLMVDKLFGGSK